MRPEFRRSALPSFRGEGPLSFGMAGEKDRPKLGLFSVRSAGWNRPVVSVRSVGAVLGRLFRGAGDREGTWLLVRGAIHAEGGAPGRSGLELGGGRSSSTRPHRSCLDSVTSNIECNRMLSESSPRERRASMKTSVRWSAW